MRFKSTWPERSSRTGREDGMALITVIMVMMLVSALMVGFVAAVMADNRSTGLDRDQTQAYVVTHAGLEKLTSDLTALFLSDFSPSPAQINALLVDPPVLMDSHVPPRPLPFQFLQPDGTSGYRITWDFSDAAGNPAPDPSSTGTITHGPYQGFKGLITPYNITVTARSTGGAEVRMRRTLQTIAVPVFQFGMFSENDLSFFAGANFNFGGRVHSNGNLFITSGDGATLTMADRITAVGEIVRTNLSNGWANSTNYTGTVNIATTIMANPANNLYRALARTEGSLVGTIGSAATVGPPTWTTLSTGTYNSNIRTWLTGARRLDLPLVSQGAVPVDLIRRPAQSSNENTTSPQVHQQRYFSQASLRILLSDTAADITNLPTVTATAPVRLDDTSGLTVDATHPPIAASAGPLPIAITTTGGQINAGATVIPITANNFAAQALMVGSTAVTCFGRDATHFYKCSNLPLAASGTAVTGNVTIAGSVVAAATTTNLQINATGSGGRDGQLLGRISVVSTAAFGPMVPLVWLNVAGAAPVAVTCAGADNTPAGSPYTGALTRLNGCSGINVNIPNNTPLSTNALSNAGQSLINGFIKIEKKDNAGTWTDVTTEILNLGIASTNQAGTQCGDPNPTAILRLQRLRDNGGGTCYYLNSLNSNDYWPNGLYDTREGLQRDSIATTSTALALGGAIQYIALDVNNLRQWFAGTIGATGNQARNDNGYIVYFSDRRNNRNAAGVETGEYGFEDVVNPSDTAGVPDGVLQTGEDSGGLDAVSGRPLAGGNGVLDTYGQTPPAATLPTGATAPYTAAARPNSTIVGGVAINAAHAMVNRQILFRRALKLVNGGSGQLPPGFTVASENPVYIHGNYNATANIVVNEAHVPAAVLADAVTVLSTNWRDVQSFRTPNDPASRAAVTTGYRVAIVSGKNPSFPRPTVWASDQDFGTDGGAHNFLRYLENWGGTTLNYRGSIVSFFFSRQATGTYKCCTNVYGVPTRGYNFDTEFLTPSLLPPGTPMFRDTNTLTFRQLLRPNQ